MSRVPGRRATVRLVDLSLLAAVIGTVATGVVADRLDLHQLVGHRQLGYAMAVLVVAHIALHRRGRRRPGSANGGRAAPVERSQADPRAAAGGEGPVAEDVLTRRAAVVGASAGVTGLLGGWFARRAVAPAPYDGGDPGAFYHRESSLGITSLLAEVLDWGSAPPRYQSVPGAARTPLPKDWPAPDLGVADALGRRRSLRRYAERPITAAELAWLVHAATGITAEDGRRTAPSAGALYPVELYVAVADVEGVDAGLYHVDVRASALERVRHGSVAGDLMLAGLGQSFLRQAPVVLVLTGVFQRTRWKYHARHYRYVCWEAGHVAQNVCLAAEAASLGACVVGAFFDRALNDLLGIDGKGEAALGMIALGAR
ncbi:MAG: SagB/ThcOx family dehydrogenase [Acidimicrobiia bacterium]|nr:SagB/ThcOx family dehydrogenase [Acidimicrobiia bacterium]